MKKNLDAGETRRYFGDRGRFPHGLGPTAFPRQVLKKKEQKPWDEDVRGFWRIAGFFGACWALVVLAALVLGS